MRMDCSPKARSTVWLPTVWNTSAAWPARRVSRSLAISRTVAMSNLTERRHRQHVPPIRRVVVLVDASPGSIQALNAAARLARELGTELLAVYAEEPDRQRSVGFAFASEIGTLSGVIRPL